MFPFDNDNGKGGPDAGSMWSGNASLMMGQSTSSNNSMLSRAELISIIDEVLDILQEDDDDDMYHAPSDISPSVAEEAFSSPVHRQTESHCEDVAQSPPSSSDSSLFSQTRKAKKPRRQ